MSQSLFGDDFNPEDCLNYDVKENQECNEILFNGSIDQIVENNESADLFQRPFTRANQFNEEFSFPNDVNFEEIPIIKPSSTYEFQSESSFIDSENSFDQEEKIVDHSTGTKEKIQKIRQRLKKEPKRQIKLWSEEEERKLTYLYKSHNGDWKIIADLMMNRTVSQCKQHWRKIDPCYMKQKKQWTQEEDQFILNHVNEQINNWSQLSQKLKSRTGKQIRDRYMNHLRPGIIKNKPWDDDEDMKLLRLYEQFGPKWAVISNQMNGRSEIMIKNRFQKIQKIQKQQQITDVDVFFNFGDGFEQGTCEKKQGKKQQFNFQFQSSQISQTFSPTEI